MNQSNIWPAEYDFLSSDEKSRLLTSLQEVFSSCLNEQSIEQSASILHDFERIYLPMAAWIAAQHQNKTLVVGLNGAQGSGKSTLTKILSEIIQHGLNKSVLCISIDDLYMMHEQRAQLAQLTHPLLATRGVPGTHDIKLATSIFKKLKQQLDKPVSIPVFNKATDDRASENEWVIIESKPDIVIFEGWCVGAQAEADETLLQPINPLEKSEDPDGRWRRYVNDKLKHEYRDLFSYIDILIMLKIPDFSKVMEWRSLQEQKLRQSLSDTHDVQHKIMSEAELERFIMHFERITRNTLRCLPAEADVVLELGDRHQISGIKIR